MPYHPYYHLGINLEARTSYPIMLTMKPKFRTPVQTESPKRCTPKPQTKVPLDPQPYMTIKIMVLFWGTLDYRCRIIFGTQKGTIILTTTQ